MNFDTVADFERKIANFFGSNYCVATDSCTHALELSLRLNKTKTAQCPTNTYISIPFTFKKLGLDWRFVEDKWHDYYYITKNIIDAAVLWRENSYIRDTYMCISFQYKKHLSLGRGGCILLTDEDDYWSLKKMSYDGRLPNTPWAEQNISSMGYHYYMTPETAELGIEKLKNACKIEARQWTYRDYPDLTKMDIFN